ncbi:hypothetical protein [Candidatus Mycoplasma haematominutum]|uniref:Uncharacterized protein n=1 Tax=Candidatus Mycoplasma haematominutum 'Birmingham 1' TaxID=1116213 RepID=G8C3G2_9MOLU|nr:hypothetical protein [Candidatus Mycoplasma haematominutum]CCE66860.1 hypothetical protein MHM_03420 [Candidatus Mycoplasma haematominutum 'Birmingham 1']
MLSLAKLVSSGLTGLSATGLGAYFTPGLLTDAGESSNLLYFSNSDEFSESQLTRLTDQNKANLDKLEEIFKNYSASIAALIDSIKSEHKTITSFFTKVQETESKLQQLYEKNETYLKQLQEFMKTYYETSEKKLQIEQLLHQTKYWNKFLLSLGNVISGWGLSLEKFLCAINDQRGTKNCDTETKTWVTESESTGNTTVQAQWGGGHWSIQHCT